jgi:DNA-binding transcriptional LysR family regulator
MLGMNITAIQTFLCVVRCRNLNRAAEEMNITQSAVSARLDALDQALGARLLIRSRKGATLTKEGFAFLEQAEVIARSWDNAKNRISLPKGVTHLFSFACAPGLWTGLGQVWIEAIRKANPETAIEIWTGGCVDAQRWLQSGMCDAALLAEPVLAPAFANRVHATENLIQVATRPRRSVQWHSDYVYIDYGSAFRADHARAWPSEETAAIAFSTPDWGLAHILAHGGSAYLPEYLVQELIADGRLFKVEGSPGFSRPSYLTWRIDREERFAWLNGKRDEEGSAL